MRLRLIAFLLAALCCTGATPQQKRLLILGAPADALFRYPDPLAAGKVIATASYTSPPLALPAGRIAVGAVLGVGDDATVVDFTVNGVTQNRTFNKANLANLSASYFEDGVIFELAEPVTTTITVANSAGKEIKGFIVRAPDTVSGVVEDQGGGTHCAPAATVYGGKLYRTHTEIYTGNRYVSIDGAPAGKIFDYLPADYNEKYHNGVAVHAMAGGVVFGSVGHNQPYVRLRYAPDGDIGQLSAVHQIGGATSRHSYLFLASLDNGDLLALTRGTDTTPVTNEQGAHVYRISDIDGTPTATADYIAGPTTSVTTERWYPRMFERRLSSNGQELIVAAWALRNGATWARSAAAVFNPAESSGAGKWYNYNGTEATNNATVGTPAAPRFPQAQITTAPSSGTTPTILGGLVNGQRYVPQGAVLFDLAGWDTTGTKKALVSMLYVDTPTSPATDSTTYATCTLNWVLMNGTTRTLTAITSQLVTTAPNSYRVEAALQYVGPTAARLLVSDRGNRLVTDRYGQATDLYYDWGATSFKVMNVTNPFTTSPTFSTVDTISVPDPTLTAAFVSSVENGTKQFVYQDAANELHPTHRQGVGKSYTAP